MVYLNEASLDYKFRTSASFGPPWDIHHYHRWTRLSCKKQAYWMSLFMGLHIASPGTDCTWTLEPSCRYLSLSWVRDRGTEGNFVNERAVGMSRISEWQAFVRRLGSWSMTDPRSSKRLLCVPCHGSRPFFPDCLLLIYCFCFFSPIAMAE